MKRGDAIIIRRFGKPGRPRKGVEPTLTPATIVKVDGRRIVVDIAGDITAVHRKQVQEAASG